VELGWWIGSYSRNGSLQIWWISKKCLEEYAGTFGVENKEDFELEKISESIINVRKKYIQHIVYEDGITFDRMSYIFPKVLNWLDHPHHYLLEKIVGIVKYLFLHPDSFNIKDY
jgi:hypothetical protein